MKINNRQSVTKSVGGSIISACDAFNETVEAYTKSMAYLNTVLSESIREARADAIDNLVSNYGYTKAQAESAIPNYSKGA